MKDLPCFKKSIYVVFISVELVVSYLSTYFLILCSFQPLFLKQDNLVCWWYSMANIKGLRVSGFNLIAKRIRLTSTPEGNKMYILLNSCCFIFPIIQTMKISKMKSAEWHCQSHLLGEAWIFAKKEPWQFCKQRKYFKVCLHCTPHLDQDIA